MEVQITTFFFSNPVVDILYMLHYLMSLGKLLKIPQLVRYQSQGTNLSKSQQHSLKQNCVKSLEIFAHFWVYLHQNVGFFFLGQVTVVVQIMHNYVHLMQGITNLDYPKEKWAVMQVTPYNGILTLFSDS